jgi:hypothetical protein
VGADSPVDTTGRGIDIPGLPTLSEQVRLIADRVVPLLA